MIRMLGKIYKGTIQQINAFTGQCLVLIEDGTVKPMYCECKPPLVGVTHIGQECKAVITGVSESKSSDLIGTFTYLEN